MRIGVVALLHESNTFVQRATTWADFQAQTLLEGEPIVEAFADAHHEVGGFLEGLRAARESGEDVELVPLLAARALPSGTVDAATWRRLMERLHARLDDAGRLDGVLAAPHGATVSEEHPDADGHWLGELRRRIGPRTPLVATIDPHANLSPTMVGACDALIAYRTNPHLDQRARGLEAARLLLRTVRGECRPRMCAEFPPLAINIERQLPAEPPLSRLYALADRQLAEQSRLLTNSIVLGFPYADVAELGSSVIAVADGDDELARRCARELAQSLWDMRLELRARLLDIDGALDECANLEGRICLLDMGDNVGGGSAADGTWLAAALARRPLGPAFVCLYDPECVEAARRAGPGATLTLAMGGKSDTLHGPPWEAEVVVRSLHEGRFREPRPRHGGIVEFDQGLSAVVEAPAGITVLLTSRRMTPFSLEQLRSCGLDPAAFRVLVAKGVNAPVAAYAEVCSHFVRVNTPGSTCADMTKLTFHHRRRPLDPFETV